MAAIRTANAASKPQMISPNLHRRSSFAYIFLFCLLVSTSHAFQTTFSLSRHSAQHRQRTTWLRQSSTSSTTAEPMVFASGSSTKPDLVEALVEAVKQAVAGLPRGSQTAAVVDLAILSVSSLYDGGVHLPSTTVTPTVQSTLTQAGYALKHLMGCSVAGCIASSPGTRPNESAIPFEYEGVPAVSVTLAILPDTNVRTFHVAAVDIPEEYGRMTAEEWNRCVGLKGIDPANPPVFVLFPSPAFATRLDNFLQGLTSHYPNCQTVGGVASTVSSLSRAKLYHADTCFSDGCVGVAIQGDIALRQLTAQGAKPVGGIYQILKGEGSTISVIVLDETATNALREESNQDDEVDDEEEEEPLDARAQRSQFYAKARIPKPVLAEANFLMRTLSDDDQAFMRRCLLVGLEQGGSTGRTASELARLANGEGHRFTVHQVATAGMKDGSVTLPLGSVDISVGTRLRFFVRESEFAKKEVDALWTGYKKRLLSEQFEREPDALTTPFTPVACLLFPTLDRGSKFFLGKQGYESRKVARVLSGIPCISGFFSNGVIGRADIAETAGTGVQGSATGYFLLGSKSVRPLYSPSMAAAEEIARMERQAVLEAEARATAANDATRKDRVKTPARMTERAPRGENGELILKRREVHSGRALTVSAVEWSVAEKTAQPTSALEGFMWDKETEVDRFRERVPLANLVSQCRLASTEPGSAKPRDWVGPLKRAASRGFVFVPECKRMEPATGSLRRRYDVSKLVREFTLAGVPVTSINCDGVLFGGSLDDVTKAREASSAAAAELVKADDGIVVPPILAYDLVLYPYQLYKMRLVGADAVNLVVGSLAKKDLIYLTKIASSLKLQTLVSVTSEEQLRALLDLPDGAVDGLIVSNRNLEDFTFDMTGEQALRILRCDTLRKLRELRGSEFPVLVEGRVGIIERPDANGEMSSYQYIKEIEAAGAMGAIVGGGLVGSNGDSAQALEVLKSGQVSR